MGLPDNPSTEPSLPPTEPPPPRIWTALAVGTGILPVTLLIGIFAVVTALALDGRLNLATDPDGLVEWIGRSMTTPVGFVLFFVMPQAAYLAAAWVPASLSPVPFGRRLGFVRGRLPLWSYLLFVVATPITGFAAHLMLAPFVEEPGGSLELLIEAFRGVQGPMAVVLVLFLTVAPAVAEESVFRGYVLRRLLQRWHPALVVALTAALFAAAHMDPVHSLGVLPLGIWLGVLAWRDGSIWPAVICHGGNNCLGIVATRFSDPETPIMTMQFGTPEIAMLSISGLAFIASLFVLIRFPRN